MKKVWSKNDFLFCGNFLDSQKQASMTVCGYPMFKTLLLKLNCIQSIGERYFKTLTPVADVFFLLSLQSGVKSSLKTQTLMSLYIYLTLKLYSGVKTIFCPFHITQSCFSKKIFIMQTLSLKKSLL